MEGDLAWGTEWVGVQGGLGYRGVCMGAWGMGVCRGAWGTGVCAGGENEELGFLEVHLVWVGG